jgi:hypothetical protein
LKEADTAMTNGFDRSRVFGQVVRLRQQESRRPRFLDKPEPGRQICTFTDLKKLRNREEVL